MASSRKTPVQSVEKGPAQPLKPAPNKAMPPKPSNPRDVEDIERSDSEGMAQPQGLPPHPTPEDDDSCCGKSGSGRPKAR